MQIPVNCLHNVFLAMCLSQHEEFSSKLGQVEERYMQVYKDTVLRRFSTPQNQPLHA